MSGHTDWKMKKQRDEGGRPENISDLKRALTLNVRNRAGECVTRQKHNLYWLHFIMQFESVSDAHSLTIRFELLTT